MLKVYIHETCSTCRNAIKWLSEAGVAYKAISIRQTPPSKSELKRAIQSADGNLRKVFNTSGMDYRALGMKDKLASLSEAEAIDTLSQNGMLVKRPFAINGDTVLVGFKIDEWQQSFGDGSPTTAKNKK